MTVQVCGQCTTRMAVGLPACPQCGSADLRAEATTLPSIVVQCGNSYCGAYGRQARIVLRQVAPGFLEAPPALLCRACGYVPETVHGWPYDPTPTPQEGDMAKITVHGGPSNAAADTENPAAEPGTDDTAAADDKEVSSSPGTTSSTSSGKARKKPGPKPASRQRRAPTTENPSETDQTDSSTAPGTDGDQTEPTSDKA